jgi:TrmH family RNA methyltransferase
MSIRIVLVGTSHPGNIGSAARAMKTMGLESLYLVAPERFPAPEATSLAAGADDVLENARVVPDVSSAIADCGLVVGTTARGRHLSWRIVEPREAALEVAAAAQSVRTTKHRPMRAMAGRVVPAQSLARRSHTQAVVVVVGG